MNGVLLRDTSSGEAVSPQSSLGAGIDNNTSIPGLPMEGWPSCFGPAKKSVNREYYEVMLNESAGDQKGEVWKFYPPKHHKAVTKLTNELKGLHPFVSDEDLMGDVELLCDYVAQTWIMEDNFTDHINGRYEFRKKHQDVWNYSKKYSKLRRNGINLLGTAVHMINRDIGSNVPTRLNTLGDRINSERYDDKTFAEKVAFIEEIDHDIVQYLQTIHSHISSK